MDTQKQHSSAPEGTEVAGVDARDPRWQQILDRLAQLASRLEDACPDDEDEFPVQPAVVIRLTPEQYADLERQLGELHDRLRPHYLTEKVARDFATEYPEITGQGYLELIPALFSLAFDSYVAQSLGTAWEPDRLTLTLSIGNTGEDKPTLDDVVGARVANQLGGYESYNLDAKCGFRLDPRWQSWFEWDVKLDESAGGEA
jgi:hypothetical protein